MLNKYCFPEWDVFLIHLFNDKHKVKEHVSFESCAIFGKICYVACVINHPGQLICLHASLHKRNHAGLIENPALKSKVQ